MEVIKQGTKDLATCGKCGSVLRYVATDIVLREHKVFDYYDEIEPEDNYRSVIVCPVCTTNIPVQTSRAQRRVLLDLKRRRDYDL